MENRLSLFGVGPKIFLSAISYAALAGAATYLWPDVCLLPAIPYRFLSVPAGLLLILGIPMWAIAGVSVTKAYKGDQLVTSGIFGICRHPLYAAWIVFILPGLVLLSRSWPVMMTPVVAYLVFKLLIRQEDDYLRERFGKAYVEYRAKVSELIPTPRL